MNDDSVKEQLRAGSILEAIRIRKIGYGYRMSYDSFADQFWPILGTRVYDADRTTAEAIFQRASTIATDPEELKLIAVGEDQGWQCGVTKLFFKDELRYTMEATLNRLRDNKARAVQSMVRGKLARNFSKRRSKARSVI